LGVQCNFQENGFTLSSSTITGTSSTWGLPNVITDKSISCDRYVYITPLSRFGFNFDLLVNNVNNVVYLKNYLIMVKFINMNRVVVISLPSALQTFKIPYDSLTGNNNQIQLL
jgi:hypothetical protein